MTEEVFAAESEELGNGDRKIVNYKAHEIGLFKWDGNYYAYSNYCIHRGGPVCEGLLLHQTENVIGEDKRWLGHKLSQNRINFVCPWHGYEYDLFTGECVPDRRLKLRKYDVTEKEDGVYVHI